LRPIPKPTTKKKRKSAATGKVKKLDAAVREIVFRRDGACVICGSTDRLQWSHLITRARYRTRWDTRNSAVMCAACHYRHHKQGPEAYTLWFIHTYGLAEYEALCRDASTPLTPAERRALVEQLVKELT
jgi:5-methylcytosine-specific restriction endonuclease McrA